MDAVKYLKEVKRMCNTYVLCKNCGDCPMRLGNDGQHGDCGNFIDACPEEAVELVEQWSNEHPIKTRQSEFLKMFPNVSLDNYNVIDICPIDLNTTIECLDKGCVKCRKEYWSKEIKEEIK